MEDFRTLIADSVVLTIINNRLVSLDDFQRVGDGVQMSTVFKLMKGYGEHIQLSVFRCSLTKTENIELRSKLSQVLHHAVDQVLIIYLGPLPERKPRVRPIGRPYQPANPGSRVL